MRRTTILLGDDLADQLDYERRRRNQSTAAIVREALTAYLTGGSSPKQLGFIGLGHSGHRDTSARIEEILTEEWARRKPSGVAQRKRRPGTARRRR